MAGAWGGIEYSEIEKIGRQARRRNLRHHPENQGHRRTGSLTRVEAVHKQKRSPILSTPL
jgi:hypothetical protein